MPKRIAAALGLVLLVSLLIPAGAQALLFCGDCPGPSNTICTIYCPFPVRTTCRIYEETGGCPMLSTPLTAKEAFLQSLADLP